MKTFDFELTFKLPVNCISGEELLDALFEAGLDDSVPGTATRGYLGLKISRDADCAQYAFTNAIEQVGKAVPGAEFIAAKPDLIGITEAAFELGRTRQALTKLIKNDEQAPAPVHAGKGGAIWHFDDLLVWLRDEKNYGISDELIEVAITARDFNAVKACHRLNSANKFAIELAVNRSRVAA